MSTTTGPRFGRSVNSGRHPADRHALAKLRAGEVDASREIRTAQGWEHEHDNPAETRQALAETAVTDADRHGSDQVAVLAVSHADCEDLADRAAPSTDMVSKTDRGEGAGGEPQAALPLSVTNP